MIVHRRDGKMGCIINELAGTVAADGSAMVGTLRERSS